ncbi:MAG: redoxin domain-containing protein [Chloroflexi bacterium]|nr:redoxin domain-containing protein [Chloroflexota bacterium]
MERAPSEAADALGPYYFHNMLNFITFPRRHQLNAWSVLFVAALITFVVACGASDNESPDEAGDGLITTQNSNPRVSQEPNANVPIPDKTPGRGVPELTGLAGWINSEPFTIAERTSEGGVVLIDFWTYTCVNCIRTFSFLQDWNEKYADASLTILGVHTPEFDFEMDRQGVLDSMERFGLEYPVAQDNERGTWTAFENGAWPAKYLFDSEGSLVYTHIGEGDYVETEQAIRTALTAAGRDLSGIAAGTNEGPVEDASAIHLTEELYAGYGKVYGLGGSISIAPVEYYLGPDRVVEYTDPDFHHFDKVYLQGPWLNEKDAIVHARSTTGLEDYIYALVFARSANVVLEHRGESPIEVFVELDGGPVPVDGAGPDIEYDEAGRSLVRVDESRLYALLELPEYGQHELVIRSDSDRFAVSSFTFGNYLQGP